MPFCAVWTCRESGPFACKKSEGQIISFHRFPTNRGIRAKWIKATGQLKTMSSWRPKKESTICSKHFKKEDFLDCTELKTNAVPICEGEQDGIIVDSVDSSETDSVDDTTELPQHNENITNQELTKEDEEIPIEYEPAAAAPTTTPHGQPESKEPIAVQDSEPEFSETSSELEFTELDPSDAKSGQLSVDALENPQGRDEQLAYGMKISNVYSTRKRNIEEIKGQMKTNIKMYRIDPVTNTVRPVTSIPKDGFVIDPAKPPVLKTQNRNSSGKPIYLLKKSAESLDGNSQKTKTNLSSQVQHANSTTKNIAPEEQKRVYSTPVPKLAQINPELSAKETDVQTLWKATKLNPTMETADSVKNPRMITVRSIINKISPSASMSKAPDGCQGPQLKLRNKKKHPRLAPAIQKPTTSVAASADLMPTSIVSTPSPAHSMPKLPRLTPFIQRPTTSVATPVDSMPTSTVSTPTFNVSTPTSTVSTPSLAYLMPTPAESTPSLADSLPIPEDSTPTPADSMPKIADTMPKPADSSPAVEKLDDSSIHILDEYDAFAKHVATQLRQLSLESYLSAQTEIQSTLSRYRLRDVNLIKRNLNFNMESPVAGRNSSTYLRQRDKANASKRKFLNKLTEYEREIKRAKDRVYYQKKKLERTLKT